MSDFIIEVADGDDNPLGPFEPLSHFGLIKLHTRVGLVQLKPSIEFDYMGSVEEDPDVVLTDLLVSVPNRCCNRPELVAVTTDFSACFTCDKQVKWQEFALINPIAPGVNKWISSDDFVDWAIEWLTKEDALLGSVWARDFWDFIVASYVPYDLSTKCL